MVTKQEVLALIREEIHEKYYFLDDIEDLARAGRVLEEPNRYKINSNNYLVSPQRPLTEREEIISNYLREHIDRYTDVFCATKCKWYELCEKDYKEKEDSNARQV